MKRAAVLALVAVSLLAGGASAADAPVRTVTIPGKLYEPDHLDVLVGTTVTWKNDDAINHTVTADDDAFSSGFVPPGGSFTFTFAKQGRYPFHCTIHKFMKGEVDVFGLVLSGPEGPVASGRRVVFAGLAPIGTETVTLRGAGSERTVRARPDGSFVVGVPVGAPAVYRALAGSLLSPAVRVLVRPLVRVVKAGDAVHAATDPARPGATAVLQSYDRERFAWRPVSRSKLDGRSQASFAIPSGADRVRVLVVGGKGWADAASRPLVLSAPH
jgi:plastocyanin